MSGISTICRFMVIVLIICAIVAPVFSSEPLNKGDAIILLIFTIPWAIGDIIVDANNSAKLETKIKFLEDRVKELEDKKK